MSTYNFINKDLLYKSFCRIIGRLSIKPRKVNTRRLRKEQIAAVVVPGRGEKNDAMWHVPQRFL